MTAISSLILQIVAIYVMWMILRMLNHKSKETQRFYARRRLDERRRLMNHLELYERERSTWTGLDLDEYMYGHPSRRTKPTTVVDFDWRKEGF